MELAKHVLRENLCARSGETIVVVADTAMEKMAKEFVTEGAEFVVFSGVERHGQEPPEWVGKKMLRADIFMLITEKSLSHTKARMQATGRGARGFSSPGLEKTMLEAVLESPKEMAERNGRIISSMGDKITVLTEGLELEFSVEGRKWFSDDGMLCRPSSFGNLPAGEVFVAPVEGSANGEIVANFGMERGTIKISNGMIKSMDGLESLEQLLHGNHSRMLAEFGIGTNSRAFLCGNVLMDEKVMGTCHIAFGTNISFGGKIDAGVHIDVVIESPTVYSDGRIVMENGKLVSGDL